MICAIPVRGAASQFPGKIRFADWIRYKEAGIAMDVNTVEAGWGMKNMPTVGGEFGFLIIPMGYQEETIPAKVIYE